MPRLSFGPVERPSNQLALHPGSGSESKNWPESSWAELLDLLMKDTESQLLLVGGEAEGERLRRLAAPLSQSRVRVAQRLPLVELARLMQPCSLFVGHDSGIAHLASALGLSGIILWGNSNEDVWRPASDKMVVLRHASGLERLPVSEVIQAIRGNHLGKN